MENIIVKQVHGDANDLVSILGGIIVSSSFLDEMGEPIRYKSDQVWRVAFINDAVVGFIAHNYESILYAYVYPDHRRKGILTALYSNIPDRPWKVVASKDSMPFFVMKKGFKIIKSYRTCFKLKKD